MPRLIKDYMPGVNRNYTGILNYLLVYDKDKEYSSPVGYGFTVYYHNKEGNIRQNHTLMDNRGNALEAGWWTLKCVSDDILVVVNRSIQ